MTAPAGNAIRRRDRTLSAGGQGRAVLLDHLRSALDEVRADPSRHLALLLIRIPRGSAQGGSNRRARIELQERLRSAVRSKAGRGCEDRVAWLGGLELAVLTAPLKQIQDAGRIAERLMAVLEAPAGDREFPPVRATIGVVALSPRHRSAEQALAEARQAAVEPERQGGWRLIT